MTEKTEKNSSKHVDAPVAKRKLTEEEKAAYREKFRRVELNGAGRLYVDEKYKEPGKVLRIDNDDPQTRKTLSDLGYTVVQDDTKVGSGSLSEPGQVDSYVRIEQAIYGESQPGLLYKIDEEVFDLRKQMEKESNDAQLQGKVNSNASESFKRTNNIK